MLVGVPWACTCTCKCKCKCICITYAVLFLLPLGCRSEALLWKDESGSAWVSSTSTWTAESALLCGELDGCGRLPSLCCCCELAVSSAGEAGWLDMVNVMPCWCPPGSNRREAKREVEWSEVKGSVGEDRKTISIWNVEQQTKHKRFSTVTYPNVCCLPTSRVLAWERNFLIGLINERNEMRVAEIGGKSKQTANLT